MKAIRRIFLFTLIPALAALPAGAQTTPDLPQSTDPPTKTDMPVTQPSNPTWRASRIIGTNVKNAGDETIGEIKDLIVDLKAGQVIAVVISSGGFLGIADTLSSVPVSAIRYDNQAKAFKTKLTKEQLQAAPRFGSSEWPDYDDPATREKFRTYRESLGTDAEAPDNSAQNKTETDRGEVNPLDQGNSDADRETTRKIRAAVVDADLSFNTKNIKIITRDGHVTLKGVVKNHDEHEKVLGIAGNYADKSKITDELKMEE